MNCAPELFHSAPQLSRNLFTVSIAASRRHLAAVRLLRRHLMAEDKKIRVSDWTQKPLRIDSPAEQDAVYRFCRNSCIYADLVIYFGASGQDAAAQVGMACAAGVPVIGIKGEAEEPGLMLNGAVTAWKNIDGAIRATKIMANCLHLNCRVCSFLNQCYVGAPYDE